uniref:Uncharacterized protein n=1 Tax=Anguilla anguilla TaxID=7936 RepID=A0A0E9RZ97_ANGAN
MCIYPFRCKFICHVSFLTGKVLTVVFHDFQNVIIKLFIYIIYFVIQAIY